MALTEKQKEAAFVSAYLRAKTEKPNPFKGSASSPVTPSPSPTPKK